MYDIKSMNKKELMEIIESNFNKPDLNLREEAVKIRKKYYGDKVYIRGLIEFSNYCHKNCYYCGINASNKNVIRYRLIKDDILECCKTGYELGFRTFVLQGGEDKYFNNKKMCDIVYTMKNNYPDCAITLSLGEKSKSEYKALFDAGGDRYLLRHETATEEHYKMLHPTNQSINNRKNCLYQLKEIGYQVGAGFLVDSPYQTVEYLANDIIFIRDLEPHMVGIGPFIPHSDTIFKNEPAGLLEHTLVMLSLIRLCLPKVLLPSTTALGTIVPDGREQGLKAGANVVMPNLSPVGVREKYSLYNNKICTGEEAAECIVCLTNRIKNSGYVADFSIGDHVDL